MIYFLAISFFSLLALVILILISYLADITIPFLGGVIRRQYFKTKFKIDDDLARHLYFQKTKQEISWFGKFYFWFQKIKLFLLGHLVLLFKSRVDSFALINFDQVVTEERFLKHVKKKHLSVAIATFFLILFITINITALTCLVFSHPKQVLASALVYTTQLDWLSGTADSTLDLTSSPGDIKLGISSGFSETQTSQIQFQAGTSDANTDLTTTPGDIQLAKDVDPAYYVTPGVFISSAIDAGESATWSIFSTNDVRPAGTDIFYETRTSENISPTNVALASGGATATSSSVLNYNGGDYTPDKAIDGMPWDGVNQYAWANAQSANAEVPQWLEIDLPSSQLVGFIKASSTEYNGKLWYPTYYMVEAWVNSEWVRLAESSNDAAEFSKSFTATTTDKVRLLITGCPSNFADTGLEFNICVISEFEIYAADPSSPWSAWQDVGEFGIQSPAGRYLQYRSTLSTTDNTTTPAINDVTVGTPSSYYSSGMYTSPVANGGNIVTWNSITAASTTPSNDTSIELAYRVGNTSSPDGSWSGWASTTGAIATSSQYLQYRAFLTTTDTSVTPTLSSVTLDYTVDSIPPTIDSVLPINEDNAVATSTTVTVIFSEPMATSTITSASFTLEKNGSPSIPVSGMVSYDGLIATFTPDDPLDYGSIYTGTITTEATDLAGNNLAENYSWYFQTIEAPDVIPPSIDSTSPETDSILNVDSAISASFSEQIDCSAISTSTAFILLKNGITPVNAFVSCSGFDLEMLPDPILDYSSSYTARISTDVVDMAGNHLISTYSWNFTTEAPSDVEPPVIDSFSPVNNFSDVSIDSNITAVFSEDIDESTITTSSFTLRDSNNGVAGSVSYANQIATFNPTQDLECSHEYFVTLTTAITDLASNPMSANRTWQFITSCSSNSSSSNSGSSQTSSEQASTVATTTTVTTATSTILVIASSTPASIITIPLTPEIKTPIVNPANPIISPKSPVSSPDSTDSPQTPPVDSEQTGSKQETLAITEKILPGQIDLNVSILKQMLIDLDYLPDSTDTSNITFDQVTVEAVKNFQSDNNIPTTGVVGDLTISALNRIWLELGKKSEEAGLGNLIPDFAVNTEGKQVGSSAPEAKSSDIGETKAEEVLDSLKTIAATPASAVVNKIITLVKDIAVSAAAGAVSAGLAVSFAGLVVVQLVSQVNSVSQIPSIFINLFSFLAYRKKRRAGIVYDAKTGQPVPFAQVTIYDNKTQTAKETKVTDKYGSYFFLVPAGDYTITATKTGYNLLSAKEAGQAKTSYASPYTRGKVLSFQEEDIINDNIPIERIVMSDLEKIFSRPATETILSLVFFVGLVLSAVFLIANPTAINYLITSLYLFLSILKYANLALPRWGLIRTVNGAPEAFSLVEVFNQETKAFYGRTVADQSGRYAFILDQGKYSLKAKSVAGQETSGEVGVKRRRIVGKNLMFKK